MMAWLAGRLAGTVLVLLAVSTLVFFVLYLVPGDPAALQLGESATAADVAQLRARWGLDRPAATRYADFLRHLASGDLETSLSTGRPVGEEIAARLPYTARLAAAAIVLAVLVAVPAGVLQAVRRGTAVDAGASLLSLVGISVPSFWLGPLLILLFSIRLGWLPVSGADTWRHLVLPALTLGAGYAALLARMTRASMLEELHENYVATARAKGLAEGRVLFRHALRNALLPVVTVAGLQFGALLTGSIVTEEVFAWPGIGRYAVEAIRSRDVTAVQGVVLFFAAVYVAVNLATDVAYAVLDPRIRRRA